MLNRSMRKPLVALVTIVVMLLIPALATGTLTEVGSVGFGVGLNTATGPTGPTGKSGKTGTTGKSGKPVKKHGTTGSSGATGSTGNGGTTGTTPTVSTSVTGPLASCPGAPC